MTAGSDEVVLPVRGADRGVDAGGGVVMFEGSWRRFLPSGRTPSMALQAAWNLLVTGTKATKCKPTAPDARRGIRVGMRLISWSLVQNRASTVGSRSS